MIEITNEQIERVNLILSGVPNGAEKAITSVIQRATSTVRSEVVKGITGVYAISRQNIRAETTIKVRTRKADGGVVGTVSFAGYKLPLYRFNVSPTLPVKTGENTPVKTENGWRMLPKSQQVKAAVKRSSPQTPFIDAFIAEMNNGHTGMFERDGTARLPIFEKMGLSVPQMAANSVVLEQVEEKAQEVINKRIEHEITRILNGYGG